MGGKEVAMANLQEMGQKAVEAKYVLQRATTKEKNQALLKAAEYLCKEQEMILAANAKDIVITDKSFSPLENALPWEALCIMTLPSGIGFYTFEIQPLFSIGDVTATDIDGKTKISATVTNRHSDSRTVTMIAALRDDEGNLSKVFSSETVAVSTSEELVIENIDTSAGSVYVFFIENWPLPRAVSSMLVNVTNNVTS